MANGIPELRMRKETDRRLSFGIYLVIIVIMVALVIASIILALNDHYIAAVLPIIVICYNVWVLLVLRRED